MHTFFSSLPPHTYIVWGLCFLLGAVIALIYYVIKISIALEMLEISHEDKIRVIYILRKDFGRLDSDLSRLAAKIHYNKTPMGYDNYGVAYYGGGGAGEPASFGGSTGGGGNGGDASVGGHVSRGEPGKADGKGGTGGMVMTDHFGQPIKIVGKEPR